MTGSIETRLAALERSRAAGADTPQVAPKVRIPTPLQFVEALSIVDRESGRTVPFKLWKAQRDMLKAMVAEDRLVLVKARQLGCSWLALGLMLYYATFEPGQLFLVARQSLEEAGEGIVRLRTMNESVPDAWRQDATTDNVFSLGFENGSRIRALSSTRRMGRGLSARYVIADELSFWSDPEEQLTALEPGAQRLHVISTGAGPDDFFHGLYMQALTGEGRWRQRFYPWSANPNRRGDWYHKNVEMAPSPTLAKREYAAKPEDAFASPSGTFFERFDSTRNVQDIGIVATWSTVRCVDFGYRSPACLWVQTSPLGQPYVVAELVPHDMTTAEFAGAILAKEAAFGLTTPPRLTYVDPAGNAANVQTSATEVSIFAQMGLCPVSKASGIREGCIRLMDVLADPVIPLVVSARCEWLIRAFATVRPDKSRSEVYDEGSEYCHALDSLRYWAVNVQLGPVVDYEPPAATLGPASGLWSRIW